MMNSATSFTFLATLFVLLLISASIIFRSFLIRRRFRQRVEGALAQGVFIDLQPSGLGFAARFKPKVYEAWVEQSAPRKTTHWQDIMPVSALLTRGVEPAADLRLPHDLPQQRPSFLARLKRQPESTGSYPTTNILEPSTDDAVSLCVLVSMPDPDSSMCFKRMQEDPATSFNGNQPKFGAQTRKTTDEAGVPNVVLGITELPVFGAWAEAKGDS